MFVAGFAAWRFKLAERVFAIGCKMASNPLNTRHVVTDSDHLTSDLVQLVLG
jgi:hypothetical protein